METTNKKLAMCLCKQESSNQAAIPLQKINGETYCAMIDVLRMIHHEMKETDSKEVRSVLDRMRFRLIKNDLVDPHKGSRCDNTRIPGRYAVGYPDTFGFRYYMTDKKDGTPVFTSQYNLAKLYVSYKEAEAASDFMDVDGCRVLDMNEFLTEGDRFRRSLYAPCDADAGNEDADIPCFVP